MAATRIWIAGYGRAPPAAIGAAPVWIAPSDGTVPSAAKAVIASFFGPVPGASPVWIASFFKAPPAAIGATPITISGWGSGGGGSSGGSTSVWSAADAAVNGMTLSNGGLTAAPGSKPGWTSVRGTISKTSGKLYVEFFLNTNVMVLSNIVFGFASSGFDATGILSSSNYSVGMAINGGGTLVSSGFTSIQSPTGAAIVPAANDVFGLAIDFTTGNIWLSHNNVWFVSGNPAIGTSPLASFVQATVGALFPALSFNDTNTLFGIITPQPKAVGTSSGIWTLQATAASQKYAPPSGFSAWDGGTAPPPTSVWSASDASANAMTLSNGGLTVVATKVTTWNTIRGSISKTTGKLYVEFLISSASNDNEQLFGQASSGFAIGSYLGSSNYSMGLSNAGGYQSTGFAVNYGPTIAAASQNDVFAIAVDFAAGSIWFARNNVWINASNPATGSLPYMSFVQATVGALFPALSLYDPTSGVWTLQSTAAALKYAPPSGFSAWDSAATTHSPQALAYLARTVGGNEGGNGANIATLIDGLVSDGVWAKLDALYVLAQQNQTDALLNLVGTSYGLTSNGSFISYKGYSGFTGLNGMATGFDPTIGSVNFAQNSSSFGVWSYALVVDAVTQISTPSALNSIMAAYISGEAVAHSNAYDNGFAVYSDTRGLFTVDRNIAASFDMFVNGVDKVTVASATSTFASEAFLIGSGPYGPTAQTLCAAFIGASLGAAGQLALYNRLRTYMTSIGVP